MDQQQRMSLSMPQRDEYFFVILSVNTCLAEKDNKDRRIAPATQRVNSPNKPCAETPLSIRMPKSIGDAAVLITANDDIKARIAPRCLVP